MFAVDAGLIALCMFRIVSLDVKYAMAWAGAAGRECKLMKRNAGCCVDGGHLHRVEKTPRTKIVGLKPSAR
ncbi:MAG TPA: hypothetical protein DEQ47_17050 [Solibacterales bacterium]|nr:hypothetical protein [Bryobacterales bacterium]